MKTDPAGLRRRSRIVVALALAAIVAMFGVLTRPSPPSLATDVTGDPTLADRVRPLLQGALDQVSVTTIDGDSVTYTHFGADNDTEYEIGSITKTFTALLLADAIARGEVMADTTVGELLPLTGAAVADVTLAELASHRAGLPIVATRLQDMIPLYLRAVTHRDPYIQDVDGVIALARAVTLSDRGQFAYSNLGVALLGQALASASNMDYARLVQERILTPLGMAASSVPVTATNLSDVAPTGYSATGRGEAPWTLNGWAPAGGIRSTPADMVRYARALLDDSAPGIDALTPRWESGLEAFMPRWTSSGQEVGYAWFTEEIDGQIVNWHDGGTAGFASIIVLDRAGHRAVIILSNTNASVNDAGLSLIVGER
ncbi:MAG: beta-lactamase family protein [Chloroflexota bacterium]|nr:beta-lactamase family protein [Chloroflexota bacterium]